MPEDYDYGNEEDELWSSDDDPDWIPEDHGYEDDYQEDDDGSVITVYMH